MPNENDLDEKMKAELAKQGLRATSLQDMRSRNNCFVGSFALCALTLFCVFRYATLDANSYFWVAPLFVAAAIIPATISGLLRRSFRKGLMALFPAFFFPFMLCMLGAMMCGQPVYNLYSETPSLTRFADDDFVTYAKLFGDTVRTDDLAVVVEKQNKLRDDVARLRRVKDDVGTLSDLSSLEQGVLNAAVDAAQTSVQARRLDNDEYDRISTVVIAARYIGTPVPNLTVANPKDVPAALGNDRVFTVSREQLRNARATYAEQFPLWIKLFRMAGWI
ncbi:MAG: hypothetical protein KGS72_11865 [Cyanobacteria bacterium REEB67]|nr:hypothetical protein [Cyanobacteria bacterium REEB67]